MTLCNSCKVVEKCEAQQYLAHHSKIWLACIQFFAFLDIICQTSNIYCILLFIFARQQHSWSKCKMCLTWLVGSSAKSELILWCGGGGGGGGRSWQWVVTQWCVTTILGYVEVGLLHWIWGGGGSSRHQGEVVVETYWGGIIKWF